MKKLRRYIVRKYVMAASVSEAVRNEGKYKPDDVWLDEEWKKDNAGHASPLGFRA